MTRGAVLLASAIVLLALCAAGLVLLEESAVAAVFDSVPLGITLAAAAVVLAGLARTLIPRGLLAACVLTSVMAFGLGTWQRWGLIACRDTEFASTDAVRLAGTLCRPRLGAPQAGLVLVHGSGAQTRREFLYLARYFARRGIATLAYDKRGAGDSTGELLPDGGYAAYAQDAAAAMAQVAAVPRLASGRTGVLGFSEAEWVVPQLADTAAAPAFIVIAGASGLTPLGQVDEQIRLHLRQQGFDAGAAAAAVGFNDRFHDYLRGTVSEPAFAAELATARTAPWFAASGKLPDAVPDRDEYLWWRSVMDFDPTPYWLRTRSPVLILKGGEDDRSDPERSIAALTHALQSGGNRRVDSRLLPGADHVLLAWPLGPRVPPPRLAGDYPALVVDWIYRELGAHERSATATPASSPAADAR